MTDELIFWILDVTNSRAASLDCVTFWEVADTYGVDEDYVRQRFEAGLPLFEESDKDAYRAYFFDTEGEALEYAEDIGAKIVPAEDDYSTDIYYGSEAAYPRFWDAV